MIYIVLLIGILNLGAMIFFRNNKKILLGLCIVPLFLVGIVACLGAL